ncbi:hypothetical protein [Nocardia amikacinitolerans]|uniref:hypothetical protein n=1 Tax=Nocardia amikacinitolerans TaxID=756689 RepID=UPI0020A333D4|nr:hypothetical protein [Nocardia amikacinitolerans]MCP2278646.1 hypothetical protein [Nocardia amikacinitolerans]MCP2297529.1 hypothetical protein [Nocardia amikacinitolerans]
MSTAKDSPNDHAAVHLRIELPERVRIRAVLDYFGKCPNCGYPAEASSIERRRGDDTVATEIVAYCGMPCGWSAQMPPPDDDHSSGVRHR